jgi:hypothetical protein
MRTCLAPGEPEHVANDTYVGAAVAAVVGPLLATLFYVVTGERILGVSIGAAVFFLISFNSESFLDALPPARRAFLLATPESVAVDDAALDSLSEDDEDLDADERRELKLPEWYQQGPSSAWQAVSDIFVGIGLAGSTPVSTAALWALGALAFVGGGLSVLEVFYITSIVSLPAFYLGPLLAAEGAGLALGVSLAGGLPGNRAPRIGIIIGLVSSGGALALLVLLPELPVVLLVALGLGLANALAVSAARNALILRFDGVERRALASGEQWTTALCGVAGALLFTFFFTGPEGVPIHLPSHLLPSWPLPALLLLTAGGLAAAGPLLAVASPPSGRRRSKKGRKKAKPGASTGRVPTPHDEDLDDSPAADDSAYLPATGAHAAWDGEAGDEGGDWDEGYSEQYPAQRTGYGQAYDTGSYDAYDDEADPRRGPPARRPDPRRNRPRW